MPKLEKYNKDLDYSYALGIFPSIEALKYSDKKCKKLLVDDSIVGEGFDILKKGCLEKNIRIEIAGNLINKISGKKNTRSAMVFNKNFDKPSLKTNHVVLHNISDAGNLGTILRTMLGFGIYDVIIIEPATDIFDPLTIRASMGAIFQMRIAVYKDFKEYMDNYPNRNLFPFMLQSSLAIQTAVEKYLDIDKPYTLIFGNEGSGLPKSFSKLGIPVRIEHKKNIDSLNLANAAAIAIYKFTEHVKF